MGLLPNFYERNLYMTFKQIIDYVDSVHPNAFDTDTKLKWLCEAEGIVISEIFGAKASEFPESVSADASPSAPMPYARLYAYYLFAMIDFLLSDYDRYKISSEMFENTIASYAKWYVRHGGD